MTEEYNSILKNDVWEIVPRPIGKSMIDSRWFTRSSMQLMGALKSTRLGLLPEDSLRKRELTMMRLLLQLPRYTSIRTIMSLASCLGWSLYQMDVKTTFLNGMIEEEVYINQPRGFEIHGQETHVCRLKKSLYGLKQAPQAWYSRIDEYLLKLSFSKTCADSNLYFLFDKFDLLVLVLYVDDLIITRNSNQLILWCKKKLASEFDMKDIGLLHYFLGLEVWQVAGEVFLGQGKYTCGDSEEISDVGQQTHVYPYGSKSEVNL
jgi:hypothetical protein